MPWLNKASRLDWRDSFLDGLFLRRRNGVGAINDRSPLTDAQSDPAGAFAVELLDDDETPMDFVITSLEDIFGMTDKEAVLLTRSVDRNGRAAFGWFQQKEVEDKVRLVAARAREQGFPLQ